MDYTLIDLQYESPEEAINSNEVMVTSRRRRRKASKSWIKEKTFENKLNAINYVKNEKSWSIRYKNSTSDGVKVYYKCNYFRSSDPMCKAMIYLHYLAISSEVVLYRADTQHDHSSNLGLQRITDELKEAIKEAYENGKKPKQIIEVLHPGFPYLQLKQISNIISLIKKIKYGKTSISLGELNEWCQTNSNIPDNADEPFVTEYNISQTIDIFPENSKHEDDSSFRFFVSSKRLLWNMSYSEKLHIDATYKLNWNGFPVFVVGTTDMNRSFHCIGIALCENEKTADFKFIFTALINIARRINIDFKIEFLICDAATAIRKAFSEVFQNKTMIMCWAHTFRNIIKKVNEIRDKDDVSIILEDVRLLQLSASKDIFTKASYCFIKKWNNKYKEFIQYFSSQWLTEENQLCNWYEGVAYSVPSTNNALEAFNKIIKDEDTFREREPLARFKFKMFEMIKRWSNLYRIGVKEFADKITLTNNDWANGYKWAKERKPIFKKGDFLYVPAKEKPNITESEISVLTEMQWNTFDQFKRRCFSIYQIQMSNSEYWLSKSTCSCSKFFKEFQCEHVIGLALIYKNTKAPISAKDENIGQKPKRGRIAKAKKALIIQ